MEVFGFLEGDQSGKFVENPITGCVSSVDEFTATFYSNIMAIHNTDVLFGIQLLGAAAAGLLYQVLLQDITASGLHNASSVAATASGGLS